MNFNLYTGSFCFFLFKEKPKQQQQKQQPITGSYEQQVKQEVEILNLRPLAICQGEATAQPDPYRSAMTSSIRQ